MTQLPLPFFVYGTLQRGEERSSRWPHPPRLVEWATIRGRVYDLGPYPALGEGDDRVLGELWHVAPEHFPETVRVLDGIECFGHEEVDLYVRRIVTCQTLAGAQQPAYAYYLADTRGLRHRPFVLPDERGYCHWRRHSKAEPA